jgi:capsular exopolysaccharide synthesis family protein
MFRSIRTSLRYVIPSDVKVPVIMITSSLNGEGKSYVAVNTALSLAILGKRVALVGLDIRKPMLSYYFGLIDKGHLTDYLADSSVKIDDIIIHGVEHPNLDLVPCGAIPPNPAELLQSERVDELFAQLRTRYDYIIVDTAPISLVSDTYLLDRICDVTMYIFRYKYTPSEMIDFLNSEVEQKRLHNVACVLNGVNIKRSGYGYGAPKS